MIAHRVFRVGPAGALFACVALFCFASAPPANAQGSGFSGDFWYQIVNGHYTVLAPGDREGADQFHSYGFNSATNISQGNSGFVVALIYNVSNNWSLAGYADGFNLARACVHGTYPNCVDTDGWTGYATIGNNSNVNLRMQGHGVY